MNTRFKIFATYNILQNLCDFIYVLIFVIVSKCRKSPKLMNIVIYMVFMNTKMYTSPLHSRRCGVNIYYANMTRCNTHWRWTTYLILQSRFLWSNTSHRKWDGNRSNPFSAVENTSIAIHIIIILFVHYKWPAYEEGLKESSKSF